MAQHIEWLSCLVMQTISRLDPDLVAAFAEVVRAEFRSGLREVVVPAIERMLVSGPGQFRCAAAELEFYSVQQACDRLAVSVSTFYRMAKSREIRLLKRGRSTLIARAEVEGLIARMKREVR
jgi:excisionase family DNA binding protein